jgi:hypothetical protein
MLVLCSHSAQSYRDSRPSYLTALPRTLNNPNFFDVNVVSFTSEYCRDLVWREDSYQVLLISNIKTRWFPKLESASNFRNSTEVSSRRGSSLTFRMNESENGG